MPQRNLVSWSASLDGYVRAGIVEELFVFDRLRLRVPDVITMKVVAPKFVLAVELLIRKMDPSLHQA
ncbi:hypothetical protein HPP92_018081 [Vanilla planifolia]|uniref:Uncharacterized protein n=1 Tax=Vanilla planifolia TaxID=51239 RepID=A0A835QHC4_VANPL|nr:hypothetical protein HPP92_018647 [Vanilla planifolia]KAG0468753.1 hypothetical protein HPP92_018081 [Vanilla planifolia]